VDNNVFFICKLTLKNSKILNTTFRPRISKSSNELVIMWTHSNTATGSSNNWAPNHFVLLVLKEDASNCNPICIDDINELPPLSPKTLFLQNVLRKNLTKREKKKQK
jgi:hypothetical protein